MEYLMNRCREISELNNLWPGKNNQKSESMNKDADQKPRLKKTDPEFITAESIHDYLRFFDERLLMMNVDLASLNSSVKERDTQIHILLEASQENGITLERLSKLTPMSVAMVLILMALLIERLYFYLQ